MSKQKDKLIIDDNDTEGQSPNKKKGKMELIRTTKGKEKKQKEGGRYWNL